MAYLGNLNFESYLHTLSQLINEARRNMLYLRKDYCAYYILKSYSYLRLLYLVDSWPLASVCVQVGHRHRGHVGPGQAGPRLVPGKHLDTLAEVRAEPRVDGEVRRRLQTKSLATSNNQRHIAMRLTHPISETLRKSVIFSMFCTNHSSYNFTHKIQIQRFCQKWPII